MVMTAPDMSPAITIVAPVISVVSVGIIGNRPAVSIPVGCVSAVSVSVTVSIPIADGDADTDPDTHTRFRARGRNES